jgi:transcriptional regulator with XRE-family HTH domain
MPTMIQDDEARDNIALNVRRLLDHRGLTQAELAEITRENEMMISRIVRGLFVPNVGTVARIAEALDVSMDRLVSPPPKKNLLKTG